MFSLHPQLVDVPEWRFLIDPDGIIDYYCSSGHWSPYHHDLRIKRLRLIMEQTACSGIAQKLMRYIDRELFKRLASPLKLSTRYAGLSVQEYCPNYRVYVDELISSLDEFTYPGEWVGLPAGFSRNINYNGPVEPIQVRKKLSTFLYKVMNDVITSQNKIHYLEKNTWNILWYDKILELLPEARLVHVYRDPRDVVTSFTRQSWMPVDAKQSAIIYRDLMERWEQVKITISEDSYYELALEELVADPTGATKNICEFWQIPWSETLLNIDLSKSHSGRWKTDLNAGEIAAIEPILQEAIVRYGYEQK